MSSPRGSDTWTCAKGRVGKMNEVLEGHNIPPASVNAGVRFSIKGRVLQQTRSICIPGSETLCCWLWGLWSELIWACQQNPVFTVFETGTGQVRFTPDKTFFSSFQQISGSYGRAPHQSCRLVSLQHEDAAEVLSQVRVQHRDCPVRGSNVAPRTNLER